jgi:hypothetical protein
MFTADPDLDFTATLLLFIGNKSKTVGRDIPPTIY